jgi:tRNA(Ile)-lysidine synthase
LLAGYARSEGIKLGLVHVNHHLRGRDSVRDEQFVRKLALSFGIRCVIEHVCVAKRAGGMRLSLEEAARHARYAALLRAARRVKAEAIALAHTLDDQAETVLIRLVTGTGLQGLASARPVFSVNHVRFIRPLIHIEKRELLRFLKQHKIAFREDKSNRSTAFLRNRVRLSVVPHLEKKLGLGVRKTLARLAENVQSDLAFLNETALRAYRKFAMRSANRISFPRRAFGRLAEPIRYRLLRLALREVSRKVKLRGEGAEFCESPEWMFEHWQMFQELFEREKEFSLALPAQLNVHVSNGFVSIGPGMTKPKDQPGFRYSLKAGRKVRVPQANVSVGCQWVARPSRLKKRREDYAVADGERLRFPLTVRSRREGDRFWPLGQERPSKLKDFLIRKKIPRLERDRLPLMESNGEIVWVSGVGLSERVKVTQQTRRFIKFFVEPLPRKDLRFASP